MQPARRDSWKNQPLPEERAKLPIQRRFSAAEYERIALGLVPGAMEDRWFIFLEGSRLYFHRSWSGFCIFEVFLEQDSAGEICIREAWANREREQYGSSDSGYDVELLSFLIDRLLLGRNMSCPVPTAIR